ncbi:unnamed protein product [Heligmosomoides polygyrus]|uniref:Uncharacterized protein n=1 Tax=Heligmosomoides polygyrus TaxID=6339 RepID=A0A183GBR8_HELPZ|nr:unnamed protein product [Heligmosomoides polygyrus]
MMNATTNEVGCAVKQVGDRYLSSVQGPIHQAEGVGKGTLRGKTSTNPRARIHQAEGVGKGTLRGRDTLDDACVSDSYLITT